MNILKEIKKCNVSYHTLGKSDRSAMPLGNGELCASVWVDEQGELCFYMSRSDAVTEADRTVKLGMIRIALDPSPFVEGEFCQTLDVADGYIRIKGSKTSLWMCVDPEQNQILVQGESETERSVKAKFCTWRTENTHFYNEFGAEEKIAESADIVSADEKGILFYHKNGPNSIEETARVQAVTEALAEIPDFLTDRIFGGYLTMDEGHTEGMAVVREQTKTFTVRIATDSLQGSEETFRKNVMETSERKAPEFVKKLCRQFWNSYWENSYIIVKKDKPSSVTMDPRLLEKVKEPQEYTTEQESPVTLAYVLTRFMMKCCQNGKMPILYNGMLFNLCPGENRHFQSKSFGEVCTAIPGSFTTESNPDERPWCVEHLWQNVRHPYHTFLAQGEEEAMKVLFSYYRRFWDLNRFRARKYYGAEGQYNTEMTLSCGLQSIGIYGADREGKPDGYAQNRHGGSVEISPGLELLSLMLDDYEYTQDKEFFDKELIVYARDLYRYIETRFTKRENGKLVVEPLNSVETYWDAKNPLPVIAGLWSTSERILRAKDLDAENEAYFTEYQKQIPELPMETEEGEMYIQPAEMTDHIRHNVEIPELYACFPFGLYTQFRDNAELMKRTFVKRLETHGGNQYFRLGESTVYPSYSGWQTHGIVTAQLGMTEMAREVLTHNVQLKNPGTRFPAMWGPIYDGVPDTDHGANIIHLLQKMVMQTEGDRIYLLPAFPEEWDVSFKLHPDKYTVISAEYEAGKLKEVKICPESAAERISIAGGTVNDIERKNTRRAGA